MKRAFSSIADKVVTKTLSKNNIDDLKFKVGETKEEKSHRKALLKELKKTRKSSEDTLVQENNENEVNNEVDIEPVNDFEGDENYLSLSQPVSSGGDSIQVSDIVLPFSLSISEQLFPDSHGSAAAAARDSLEHAQDRYAAPVSAPPMSVQQAVKAWGLCPDLAALLLEDHITSFFPIQVRVLRNTLAEHMCS